MRDGNDVNEFGCGRVDDGERESPKDEMAQIVVKTRADLGMFEYQSDDAFDFVGESATEARHLRFVMRCGFVQFTSASGWN